MLDGVSPTPNRLCVCGEGEATAPDDLKFSYFLCFSPYGCILLFEVHYKLSKSWLWRCLSGPPVHWPHQKEVQLICVDAGPQNSPFPPGVWTIPSLNKTPQKRPRPVQSSQRSSPLLSSMALSRQCLCLLLFMNSGVCIHHGCFDAVWHARIWMEVKRLCLSPSVVDEDSQCRRQWHLSKQICWVEGGPPLFPFALLPFSDPPLKENQAS